MREDQVVDLSLATLSGASASVPGKAGFTGANNGLCPVGHLQFAEDVGDVIGHRFETEGEAPGDVAVVVSLGDQAENLAFAVGEFGEDLWQQCRLGSGKEVDQSLGNGWAEDGFTLANGPDCAQDLVLVCIFQDVASSPCS